MFQILVVLGMLIVVEKICGPSVLTFVFELGAVIWLGTRPHSTLLDYALLAVATVFWLRLWFGRYTEWDKKRKATSGGPVQHP